MYSIRYFNSFVMTIDGWLPPRLEKRVMKRLSIEENRQMLLEKFYEKNPRLKL